MEIPLCQATPSPATVKVTSVCYCLVRVVFVPGLVEKPARGNGVAFGLGFHSRDAELDDGIVESMETIPCD